MKFIKIVLSVTLFWCIPALASETSVCGTTAGTAAIPLSGTMKVYVVFAQFKDDPNTDTEGWTKNTYPSWANNFVNSTTGGTYPWSNLSHYYYEMSNGTFQVIGDVYNSLVTTDHDESYYSSIGEVNREVLLEVESSVDYSDYDFLDGSSFGTDGIVDLIIIIYRNVTRSVLMNYSAIAHLEVSSTINADGVSIVTHGGIGGGVQQRGGYMGRDYTLYVTAHELGHYLLGGNHIANTANLCLMSSQIPVWSGSKGMHSWERHKLGWISYTDKSTDGSVTLADYMTADDVIKVPVNGDTEYFLIENRKKLSSHDKAGDVGFYFYRILNGANFPPTIDVLCADGNWNFTKNTATQTLTRVSQNYAGSDEMDYYSYDSGVKYRCITPIYSENSAWGDTEDAFDLTFNNVLNPNSNPRSTNGGSIDFSIEVTGTNTITFYIDGDGSDEYAGSPSKPQNLSVTANGANKPVLTWDASSEPDFSSYQIWRKINTYSWYCIASQSTNTYTDGEVSTSNPQNTFYYKIRVKDTQNKYSVYSLEVSIKGFIAKLTDESILESDLTTINNNNLDNNFPNPFNPTTTLNYTVKEDGLVNIVVFDALGRKVKELVNEMKSPGSYELHFDGSNLPSGLYYYRMQAGEFVQTKKMILLK